MFKKRLLIFYVFTNNGSVMLGGFLVEDKFSDRSELLEWLT